MAINNKMMTAAAGWAVINSGGQTYADDVFGLYAYDGKGIQQNIVNNISLGSQAGVSTQTGTPFGPTFFKITPSGDYLFNNNSAVYRYGSTNFHSSITNFDGSYRNLFVTSNGDTYMAGIANNGGVGNAWVARISSDGTTLDRFYKFSGGFGSGYPAGVTNTDTHVYIAGWSAAGNQELYIIKIQLSDGAIAWGRYFNSHTSFRTPNMKIGSSGNIILTGRSATSGFVCLINDTNGTVISSRQWGNGNEYAGVVDQDSAGNIYVTGKGISDRWYLRKYDSSLNFQWERTITPANYIGDEAANPAVYSDVDCAVGSNVVLISGVMESATSTDHLVTFAFDLSGNFITGYNFVNSKNSIGLSDGAFDTHVEFYNTNFYITHKSNQLMVVSESDIQSGLTLPLAIHTGVYTSEAATTDSAGTYATAAYTFTAAGLTAPTVTQVSTAPLSAPTVTDPVEGSGGLVWIKNRINGAIAHRLFDTERGPFKEIYSNLTNAELDRGTIGAGIGAFRPNGFTLGPNNYDGTNQSAINYMSWTFRKQPGFFDIVTYTGDGTGGRTIPHNLGCPPGMIIIKNITTAGYDWYVWHKSDPNDFFKLNSSGVGTFDTGITFSSDPDSANFYVGTNNNQNNANNVAYLFADGDHIDAQIFGDNGDEPIIKCGSYVGNGSATGNSITLGFEPQYVMIKGASVIGEWQIIDTMRGFVNGGPTDGFGDGLLWANLPNAENVSALRGHPDANGFTVYGSSGDTNENLQTYIYIAIRRPHKPATAGDEVYNTVLYTGDSTNAARRFASGLSDVDLIIGANRNSGAYQWIPKLSGRSEMSSAGIASETDTAVRAYRWSCTIENSFTNYTGTLLSGDVIVQTSSANYAYNNLGVPYVLHSFKRSPGFFDVVNYLGDGIAGRTFSHNLGVVPEMVIVKSRTFNSTNWMFGMIQDGSLNPLMHLNSNSSAWAQTGSTVTINRGYPTNFTDTSVTLNTSSTLEDVNQSSHTYVAYLFATLPGISKVGNYVGDGTSNRLIDCGFTTSARFVMIKRTDSAGNWSIFDSARGIVEGNDPFKMLNSSNGEDSTEDAIEPDSSGFRINHLPTGSVVPNVNGARYIYLAIA